MGSNKNLAMLMVVVIMFLAMAYTAISQEKKIEDCNKECMPTCLKLEDGTVPVCQKVCKNFCQEQGSTLPAQGIAGKLMGTKSNFNSDLFMKKSRDYLSVREMARGDMGNKNP